VLVSQVAQMDLIIKMENVQHVVLDVVYVTLMETAHHVLDLCYYQHHLHASPIV